MCPICKKSLGDYSRYWRTIDQQVGWAVGRLWDFSRFWQTIDQQVGACVCWGWAGGGRYGTIRGTGAPSTSRWVVGRVGWVVVEVGSVCNVGWAGVGCVGGRVVGGLRPAGSRRAPWAAAAAAPLVMPRPASPARSCAASSRLPRRPPACKKKTREEGTSVLLPLCLADCAQPGAARVPWLAGGHPLQRLLVSARGEENRVELCCSCRCLCLSCRLSVCRSLRAGKARRRGPSASARVAAGWWRHGLEHAVHTVCPGATHQRLAPAQTHPSSPHAPLTIHPHAQPPSPHNSQPGPAGHPLTTLSPHPTKPTPPRVPAASRPTSPSTSSASSAPPAAPTTPAAWGCTPRSRRGWARAACWTPPWALRRPCWRRSAARAAAPGTARRGRGRGRAPVRTARAPCSSPTTRHSQVGLECAGRCRGLRVACHFGPVPACTVQG